MYECRTVPVRLPQECHLLRLDKIYHHTYKSKPRWILALRLDSHRSKPSDNIRLEKYLHPYYICKNLALLQHYFF